MNAVIKTKTLSWEHPQGVASFSAKNPGYSIVDSIGDFLSEDGVKPTVYRTKSVANEISRYADGFSDHVWVTPL